MESSHGAGHRTHFMKKRTAEKTVKLDTTVSATCHAAVWMWLGVLQILRHFV